jgi:hypothetical protein
MGDGLLQAAEMGGVLPGGDVPGASVYQEAYAGFGHRALGPSRLYLHAFPGAPESTWKAGALYRSLAPGQFVEKRQLILHAHRLRLEPVRPQFL